MHDRATYDAEIDAAYVPFTSGKRSQCAEDVVINRRSGTVLLGFDKDGYLVGFEVISALSRLMAAAVIRSPEAKETGEAAHTREAAAAEGLVVVLIDPIIHIDRCTRRLVRHESRSDPCRTSTLDPLVAGTPAEKSGLVATA